MTLSPSKILHLLTRSHPQTLTLTPILHARLLRTNLFPHLHLLSPLHPSPPPWNLLLAAFTRHNHPSLALQTLSIMHHLSLPIDSFALCSALTAALASQTTSNPATQIHAHAVYSGWLSSIFLTGALINFYAKSNCLSAARQLFDEMPLKNTVCVNTLLSAYIDNQMLGTSLCLILRMHGLGLEPDGVTLSAALRLSADAAVVGLGVQVHGYLVRRVEWMELDAVLMSSLVEMYGKCGLVEKARGVFELAGRGGRDVVLWTSLVNAYGRNGRFRDAVEAFEEMLGEGTRPDGLALLAVLSACSHCGCVSDGLKYFEAMRREYGIVLMAEHVGCVVDMLCRAGELERAWDVANEMVLGGGVVGVSVWGALLTACKEHGNVELGKIAVQRALELDPGNVGIYAQLSNLYASVGKWDEIGDVRELIKEQGLKKDAGCSWLGHK